MAEIEIHPMEWRRCGGLESSEWAGRPPLRYVVTEYEFGSSLHLNNSPIRSDDEDGYWPSLDAAKSAAMQDLEERVCDVARAVQTSTD